MSDAIATALAAAIGAEQVRRAPDGPVHVTPADTDAVAQVLGLAHGAGWRVAIEGAGTWQPDDAPADVVLSTRGLDQVTDLRAADLVVTAQGGVSFDQLRRTALENGTWLALDPPGRPDRTLGSVLATATAGPLRHGFGPLRDQVLGLTVVTGDGRVVRAGGTTVKNVAGFDLVKLHVGGFGGFGVITECHLRLRGLPRADTTWIAIGDRDRLTAAARDLVEQGLDAAAVELFSPALAAETTWLLAVRLLGGPEAVQAEAQRFIAAETPWRELPPEGCTLLWSGSARAISTGPVTLRLGVVPEGVDDTLDLVIARLGEGMIAAGPVSGALRWSGTADADAIRSLRGELAGREIPLTLERAPWAVRRGAGHFGAYREGVGGLVSRLQESFDPGRILLAALHGEHGT